MVVYLDSVFLLNGLLDGLLLYFTGYLAGIERKMIRIVLAGGVGGGYAVSTFFQFGMVSTTWLPIKIGTGVALVWLAYGKRGRFWQMNLVFFGLSCVLAGVVMAAGFFNSADFYQNGAYLLPIRFDLLAGSSLCCFGAIYLCFKGGLQHRLDGEIVPVSCEIAGKEVSFAALRDTGNTLCDDLLGAPVLVADGAMLEPYWSSEVKEYLTCAYLAKPEIAVEKLAGSGMPLRLMPYRSVGTASGLLLVYTAKHAKIGAYQAEKVTIALSPTPVSEHGEYDALWGGPVK